MILIPYFFLLFHYVDLGFLHNSQFPLLYYSAFLTNQVFQWQILLILVSFLFYLFHVYAGTHAPQRIIFQEPVLSYSVSQRWNSEILRSSWWPMSISFEPSLWPSPSFWRTILVSTEFYFGVFDTKYFTSLFLAWMVFKGKLDTVFILGFFSLEFFQDFLPMSICD